MRPHAAHLFLVAALLAPVAGCMAAPEAVAPAMTSARDCSTPRALIVGLHRAEPPTLAKPAKGRAVTDPVYGSCIIRVTDHDNEPPVGFARNDYSRRQPFNADGSLLLTAARDGYWHLYDARTLQHLRRIQLGGGSVEPHWHPGHPDWLFTLPNNGGLALFLVNVRTGERRVAMDFTQPTSIEGHPEADTLHDIWPELGRLSTRSEGSPSMDARYWAFQAETSDFKPLGLVTVDLEERRIVGIYDFSKSDNNVGRPNHVSMSPKGNYVVASWNSEDDNCPSRHSLGTRDAPCGLMVFSRDYRRARGIAVRGPHSDTAIDAAGNEVIVLSNYNTGYVEMIRLDTGDATRLWPLYERNRSAAMHFSGKAYDRPGWVLVSTYALHGRGNYRPWFSDKIFALELAEDPRIINIAHTYNRGDQYFSEPHAAVNRDFSRIVFNSNWGTGRDEDIDVYLIEIPQFVFESEDKVNELTR